MTNPQSPASPLPEAAEPVAWQHLKAYGYAPGNYMKKCHTCGKVVEFVDKRAITCRPCAEARYAAPSPVAAESVAPTMTDALEAGDGTLHGAVDYWQGRALAAEAARDTDETNKVLADNYLELTAQAPAQAGEVEADHVRRLAEDWAHDCVAAGYVTTIACKSYAPMVEAINALATQPLAAPVQQEAEAVTVPQVGETWYILRPGAWACARVKIHAISKLTVTFESTTYGVPNEVIPLNFGLRFVERIDATPPSQPVLAPVVREPLTEADVLRIADESDVSRGYEIETTFATAIQRACAEAWGIALTEAAGGIQATTGEPS